MKRLLTQIDTDTGYLQIERTPGSPCVFIRDFYISYDNDNAQPIHYEAGCLHLELENARAFIKSIQDELVKITKKKRTKKRK